MTLPRFLLSALAFGFAATVGMAAPKIEGVTVKTYGKDDKTSTGQSLEGHADLTAQLSGAQADTEVTFFFSTDKAAALSGADTVPHVTATANGQTAQHRIPTATQLNDPTIGPLQHDPSVTYYVHAVATGGSAKDTRFQENVAPTAAPITVHAQKSPATATIYTTEPDPNTTGATAPALDPDGDPLVIQPPTQPAHGSAQVDAGGTSITYTPNATFAGTDSFTYTVKDTFGAPAAAIVTIGNSAPTAAPTSLYVFFKTTPTIYITEKDPNSTDPDAKPLASDPDGDTLTISAAAKSTHGTVDVQATSIKYTPDEGSPGDDSFTYTVTDSLGQSASATITIHNAPPVAVDDLLTAARTGPTYLDVLANDKDREPKLLEISDPPKFDPNDAKNTRPTKIDGGTIQTVGQVGHERILFTPDATFTGVTQFQYTIKDAYGKTASATVHIVSAQALMNRSAGIALKDVTGRVAGYIRIDSFANGAFTARIEVGSKKYRLVGRFDANGNFSGVAHDEDGTSLPLTLGFGFDDKGAPVISADLGMGKYTADQAVATISASALGDLEGRYTVNLPPGTSSTTTSGDTTTGSTTTTTGSTTTTTGSTTTTAGDATGTTTTTTKINGPEGTGWMTIKVDENGDASMKGKTGDGRSFSARGVIGGTDAAPELIVYATPHSGTLAGTLKFGDTISGQFTWTRGETNATFYPDGFDLPLAATGARYERPDDGKRALASDSTDAGRGTLTISGGNVPPFTRELRFSEDDKVQVLDNGEEDTGVKIHRKDGTFSGGFDNPDDLNQHIKFTGVLIQSSGGGSGVFQGKDKAGTATLTIPTSSTGTTTQ